jgi:lipoprotein-anchoring transpeptidase ErfK/SrfK
MVPIGNELVSRRGISTEPVAQGDIPTYDEALFVAPELWIEVNLSAQYMTVWVGNEVILETYVSTGRPGFDTPTGTFYVNTKLESQTMEGVLGGEYYNVPDVPWVMYFTDVGHAIHGTYWHNNFGYVMSHGCVNLPLDIAEYLYSITPIGTRVEIHY